MSTLMRSDHYIDGQWSSGGPIYPVLNPANGELIAEVQKAGAEQTNLAIEAAQRALPGWRKLTAKERSQRLKRCSELMLSNQHELATLLSREQGSLWPKPWARWSTRRAFWSGSAKRPNAPTAM